jgi:6-phosphofructokinase 1
LKPFEEDDGDYARILEVFKAHNVRYFMYNGGNDSMDTCNKADKFFKSVGYECRVIGIPKTIDNDLFGTDHCPGYGSAAKFVATCCMEIYNDATVYPTGSVTIIEIMGRNAGWLTAATALAAASGKGPDLVYLPEMPFDTERFIEDVREVYKKKRNVLVAISEGIADADGKYIAEYASDGRERDSFNNAQLGGACGYLRRLCKLNIKVKVRAVEFSLLQRCAAHIGSKTDADEAYRAGQFAVRAAAEGKSGFMIGLERTGNAPYTCGVTLVPLDFSALREKKIPPEFLSPEKNFVSKKFLDYALPLIQGENTPPFENGLPRFARLKLVPVGM